MPIHDIWLFIVLTFQRVSSNLISTFHKNNNKLEFCPRGMVWKNWWVMRFQWLWTFPHDIRFISFTQTLWGTETICCCNEPNFDKEMPQILCEMSPGGYTIEVIMIFFCFRLSASKCKCHYWMNIIVRESQQKVKLLKLHNYTIDNKVQTSRSFLANRSLSETWTFCKKVRLSVHLQDKENDNDTDKAKDRDLKS